MDRRSWLWRRKSSEKSPGETESSGSLSSHSERFSDDQRSQSPEITSKAVTREEDGTEDVKILTERLSAALLNVSLKEDLAKQHAKVAEEAVSGWEKAEKEVVVLKQQLDDSVSKNLALEDRNSHLDSALKECVRQLRQGREEQDQKIQEAIDKKCQEWETKKSELEAQIKELQARLQLGKEEITNPVPDAKIEALEKENSALKLQLLSKAEEIEIRTIERDLSTQAAESASKQQLEGIKKLTKLEAECRKLRVMVRRSASSKELKSSMDNQSDNSERVPFRETDMQSSSEKVIGKTSVTPSVSIGLMDDFLEMEKLAALPQSDAGRKHSENNKGLGKSSAESSHLKHELEASLHRISELEEKVEMVEVEKVQLEMALDESRKQIDALQNQLMETEGKLAEFKKLEVENQDLELSLGESRKQLDDLRMQLNKAQVNLSELETIRAENHDLELSLVESRKQLEDLQMQLKKAQVNLSELKTTRVENHDLELSLVESGKQLEDLERELSRAQVSLLEVETIRAEKLELTICLNGTKKELETTQNRLKETDRKLTELQTLLRLTKDAKEAAEGGVKAANAKTEAVEARLRDVEAEAKALTLKIESLEQNTEQERALSAKHISKCEELQSEISKLKHELEHNQEPELKPHHFKGFDEDFKLKQEKELAMAASKFADCQRTIASLGQRLQSLAMLEDFLVES